MMAASLIERWYDEVWNQRLEASIDAMWHPDLRLRGTTAAPLDAQGFKAFWRTLTTKYPDLRVTVDRVVADGSQVAAQCTSHFTDAKTGQQIELRGATFATVEGDQFLEVTDTWDYLAMLETMGTVPRGVMFEALM